ncbi:MAG: phospho-N-acetylmuramoyl-pentapeptide-transferase [Acidobacteria bacterium]|nr:phospho-N-acetylmuramoyl-pentapeptide-transferase [Acidobacteriota bacterium]
MLRYLLYEWLYLRYHEQHPFLDPLNVFRYITFRTAYASATALLISLVVGYWLIRKLREFQIGQQIRAEGPQSHQAKRGTPTMGGLLVIFSVVVSTILWGDWGNSRVWLAVVAMLLFGTVGFLDDYQKVAKKQSLGLTGRQKILAQIAISLAIGVLLIYWLHYSTVLSVPFFKTFRPVLPAAAYLLFMLVVVVGSSNAVNLTDGLDGLAIGISFITFSALTAFTYVTSHAEFARYLAIEHMPEVGELTVFCGAVAGACLGFLWFNAPPADVFMGDVGSLALGGSIGVIAVMIKQELMLAMIGGVFVLEALSVMLQVAVFQATRRITGRGIRVLKMSPLHHHFELVGWRETKVVFRFLIIAILFALLSLSTLKLR